MWMTAIRVLRHSDARYLELVAHRPGSLGFNFVVELGLGHRTKCEHAAVRPIDAGTPVNSESQTASDPIWPRGLVGPPGSGNWP